MALLGRLRVQALRSLTFRIAVGLLVLVGSTASAGAGDPDLARFLLKHGKAALDRGDTSDALTKLEKARAEDGTLVEATYWIAVAHDKGGTPSAALVEYYAFLDGVSAKKPASPEEAALEKKARARVDVLDAAGRELQKANEAFAAQVYAFAAARAEKDPALAERAVRVLLSVVPAHREAQALLRTLGGGETSAQKPEAPREIADWLDLIASKTLGTNDGWTYGDRLTIETRKGAAVFPRTAISSGPTFTLEADVVLQATHDPGATYVVAIAFGRVEADAYMVSLLRDRVVLETVGLAEGRHQSVAEKPTAEWVNGGRRRVEVRVEGQRVRVYLERELKIDTKVEGREDLSGDVGLVTENVLAEFHVLRLGRPGSGAK